MGAFPTVAAMPAAAPRGLKRAVALGRFWLGTRAAGPSYRRRALGALGAVILASLTGVAGSSSAVEARSASAEAPCAKLTEQALAATDGNVAERIYRDELGGPGTARDRGQVETYAPLLRALAEGNRGAIHEAVVALVYSHTHIVRLRVSQGATLLSDVGGPYIIAPTGGNLYYQGRLVGSYLLSVQDDRGVVGLETRLVSVPLVLHVGPTRIPIKGTVHTGPVAIPDKGPITLNGRHFQAYSFTAKAYPTGSVRISLLHPEVRPSGRPCSAVRIAELGRIGRAIWYRFMQDNAPISGFVSFTQRITGALTYVRVGTAEVAGSAQPAPPSIPASGVLIYEGVAYGVTSFAAATASGSVRVYQLVAL